jgi:hypothetical protein
MTIENTKFYDMDNQIIVLTKEDLDRFKDQLISDIKEIFESRIKKSQWLRSADVREILNISDSTLQSMRINKAFPAYKLDNTWFYKYEEIIGAIEKGRN